MKVDLFYNTERFTLEMRVYETAPDGMTRVMQPVDLVLAPVDLGAYVPPTFQFDGTKGWELLQAFANALQERGVRPDSVSVLKGELEATKKHLEHISEIERDMREIVKNAPHIIGVGERGIAAVQASNRVNVEYKFAEERNGK